MSIAASETATNDIPPGLRLEPDTEPSLEVHELCKPQEMESSDHSRVADRSSAVVAEPRDNFEPQRLKRPSRRMDEATRVKTLEQDRVSQKKWARADGPGPRRRPHGTETVAAVKKHYNQRPNMAPEARSSSPIIKLKSLNNWMKSVLIAMYSKARGGVVLDLGCGKGGDLIKWKLQQIEGYIGIDIADNSVKHAQERYDKLVFKQRRFWADLCVGDPFLNTVEEIVHPDAFPVDAVSCQFCLHYAFETEARARCALENVSRALKRGGRFIGTIPNSDVIKQHLLNNELEWGNELYKVAFDTQVLDGKAFRSIYGNTYIFYLKDAVENVPEFVVPFESLRALAEEYNLQLVYERPFLEFFDDICDSEAGRKHLSLAERLRIVCGDGSLDMPSEQKEVSGFYKVFVFEKVL